MYTTATRPAPPLPLRAKTAPRHNISPEQRLSLLYAEAQPKKAEIIIKERKRTIEICVVPVIVIVIILVVLGVIAHHIIKRDRDGLDWGAGGGGNSTVEQDLLDPEMIRRRDLVVRMMKEAWTAYRRYAWGGDALRPVTKEPYENLFGKSSGLSVVGSMSTLWLMGMRQEFDQARNWVEHRLNFSSIKREVDVQHSVNYYIGGLLSCYALTGDDLFLNKSIQIADILDPAYRTSTGLPYWKIKPQSGEVSHKTPFLSVVGGQQLEYQYLADLTSNVTYRARIRKIRKYLIEMYKPHGLYMHQVDVESGSWHTSTSTLFGQARTFYSYLVKSYIQSNHQDREAIELYQQAMEAVDRAYLVKNSSTGWIYVRQYNLNSKFHRYEKYMNYDACALGAMLATGEHVLPKDLRKDNRTSATDSKYWQWAIELTRTCVHAGNTSVTKLTPYRFYYDYRDEDEVNLIDNGRYVLAPELAETYFVLWRLTHDQRYRDYAWQLAEAIHTHCRTDSGYSKISDVNQFPTVKGNLQDQEFMSTTLKYLYLTFSSDGLLSMDQWVMNARGQPLPIYGRNTAYQTKNRQTNEIKTLE